MSTYTTATLEDGENEMGAFTPAQSRQVNVIETTVPARVRFYGSNGAQVSDLDRDLWTDPDVGDVVLDLATGLDSLIIDVDPEPSAFISRITVTNLSGEDSAVTVTMTESAAVEPPEEEGPGTLVLRSFVSQSRDSGAIVFKVLARADPIVLRDKNRIFEQGSMTVMSENVTQRDQLDTILDTGDPLLLQFPLDADEPDRWIMHLSHGRTRLLSKSWFDARDETIAWQEVDAPA